MKIGNLEVYGIIYKITNKINGKVYIGQTIQKGGFDRRYCHNLKKYTHNQHLKRSIERYGIDNFEINKVFDIAFSKIELDVKERCWIQYYNSCDINYGYNIAEGGHNGSPLKGKTEEELKQIYSKLNTWQGRKHTEEEKKKISEAQKGELNHRYGKPSPIRRKVICLNTYEIFDCIKDAQNKYKVTHISECCRGNRNYCGVLEDGTKLQWKYYDEYEVVV